MAAPLMYLVCGKSVQFSDAYCLSLLWLQVEYIDLKGTTKENPATCKYTGDKFYSDDWKIGGYQ